MFLDLLRRDCVDILYHILCNREKNHINGTAHANYNYGTLYGAGIWSQCTIYSHKDLLTIVHWDHTRV